MNVFDQAITDQYESLREAAGVAVRYRRGDESVELIVVRGNSRYEIADNSGMMVNKDVLDFIILTSELVLDDENVLPMAGDRIEELDSGAVHELMQPSPSETLWRYSDRNRSRVRVHTRTVREAGQEESA